MVLLRVGNVERDFLVSQSLGPMSAPPQELSLERFHIYVLAISICPYCLRVVSDCVSMRARSLTQSSS